MSTTYLHRLSKTHPGFQAKVQKIAELASMTPDGVFRLWCQYSDSCSNADQSALLGEFVEWYHRDLGNNRAALQEAIR
jgi:hypothetical protein